MRSLRTNRDTQPHRTVVTFAVACITLLACGAGSGGSPAKGGAGGASASGGAAGSTTGGSGGQAGNASGGSQTGGQTGTGGSGSGGSAPQGGDGAGGGSANGGATTQGGSGGRATGGQGGTTPQSGGGTTGSGGASGGTTALGGTGGRAAGGSGGQSGSGGVTGTGGGTTTGARAVQNFNQAWKFYLGDKTGAEANTFDDSSWSNIGLPHSFSLPYFAWKNTYYGYGWYRKHLDVPADWSGKRVFIEFEGSFQDTQVYVNGKQIGRHLGGYNGFSRKACSTA
jgi:hypothetical protein